MELVLRVMLVAVIVVGSKQGLILVETVLVLLGKLLTCAGWGA